ncbi:MAG: hypothetical protein A4E63_00281 [Syntrophorhabdus sp. PtaU1.Bin050]|nr:MAG: hypothetical protein A4E63_00281 [Syntrophorhabdus sp. PtaU1.Bin050]
MVQHRGRDKKSYIPDVPSVKGVRLVFAQTRIKGGGLIGTEPSFSKNEEEAVQPKILRNETWSIFGNLVGRMPGRCIMPCN